MICAGFGCRRGCSDADIVSALGGALAAAGRDYSHVMALCAPDFKRTEPAFLQASRLVGKPLLWLTDGALERSAALAISRSAHVLQRFNLPSISETAALAGAAVLAPQRAVRLLGPRIVSGNATCALATALLEGEP